MELTASALAQAWTYLHATDGVFRTNAALWARRPLSEPPVDMPGAACGAVVTFHEGHQLNKRQASVPPPTTAAAAAARTTDVLRPFNPASFHFGKASPAETVARLRLPGAGGAAVGSPAAAVWLAGSSGGDPSKGGPSKESLAEAATAAAAAHTDAPHALIVNVSPVIAGHLLFLPHVAAGRPQAVTPDLLLLALQFVALVSRSPLGDVANADPVVRLALGIPASGGTPRPGRFFCGFNSCGAFASVNHFHGHAGWAAGIAQEWGAPEAGEPGLALERAPRKLLVEQEVGPAGATGAEAAAGGAGSGGGVTLRAFEVDWALPALLLEAPLPMAEAEADGVLPLLVRAAAPLLAQWQSSGVPHHFVITAPPHAGDAGSTTGERLVRLFLLPRLPQRENFFGAMGIAFMEVIGNAIATQGWIFDGRDLPPGAGGDVMSVGAAVRAMAASGDPAAPSARTAAGGEAGGEGAPGGAATALPTPTWRGLTGAEFLRELADHAYSPEEFAGMAARLAEDLRAAAASCR